MRKQQMLGCDGRCVYSLGYTKMAHISFIWENISVSKNAAEFPYELHEFLILLFRDLCP